MVKWNVIINTTDLESKQSKKKKQCLYYDIIDIKAFHFLF